MVVEMALDFWLATRIPLSAGVTIMDRTRAFSTAAIKVAMLCQGRVAPVKFKAECNNLSRLFLRPSAGYEGRAKLLFTQEVKFILAAHQQQAGTARARSTGSQWKWNPEDERCLMPAPAWTFTDPVAGPGEEAEAGPARRGRPQGPAVRGRCETTEAEVAEMKRLSQGKCRAKPRKKESPEGTGLGSGEEKGQRREGKKRPRRKQQDECAGDSDQDGSQRLQNDEKPKRRRAKGQAGKQVASAASAREGPKRRGGRHKQEPSGRDVEMEETEVAAAPTATARPPGKSKCSSRRRTAQQ